MGMSQKGRGREIFPGPCLSSEQRARHPPICLTGVSQPYGFLELRLFNTPFWPLSL